MRTKMLFGLTGGAFAFALLSASPVLADPIALPTANCGTGATNNCLTFSDFTVYSLALLQFQTTGTPPGPQPGSNNFYVPSGGGHLDNALVVASSPAGTRDNQDLGLAGVDDGFNTPTGTGPINYTMAGGETSPSFLGDATDVWSIRTDSLLSYLGTGDLTFLFNLNQTKSDNGTDLNGDHQSAQDMLATLDVYFTNDQGQTSDLVRLNGNDCGAGPGSCIPGIQSYAQDSGLGTDILRFQTDQWAYVHGHLCVSDDGAVLAFETCASAGVDGNDVDQNLGSDAAAFALFSQALQTMLESGDWDTMHVDLRMAELNNGFEQLFILPGAPSTTQVPEPLTLSLFGVGIAGAFAMRRRRKA